MKIIDMHIHAMNTKPDPKGLLAKLDKAGVFGACIFSNRPDRDNPTIGTDFQTRLNEVLQWTKGFEDRLFPVMWIHPYEDNIIENIHIAVQKGVCGFKIICSDFYVYEEQCLCVLREIAKLNKPVFFHTGILWDGRVSSSYNRPLNWEALIDIEGLRFSMGHCSWPWIDECIALYGKFLNALLTRGTAEMFFDITPGTPEIYREELLSKLYTIGYDVGDNVMFGTDSYAHEYNSDWAIKWLETDRRILDKIGVSYENREKLYYKNFMRFLGRDSVALQKRAPDIDNSNAWSPQNSDTVNIIKKWYEKLGFPHEYDAEFASACEKIKVSDAISIDTYDATASDGKRNLLSFLFLCENLNKKYKALGIDDAILLDTLGDIPIWTKTWSNVKGELYLGELSWLKRHLSGKLFKLGRLQFCMAPSEHDIPKYGIKQGDDVLEVHIPACGPLDIDECEKSIEAAKDFFAKHFPDYKYSCFTCHSWLLDPTLCEHLGNDSNIVRFGKLFDVIDTEQSDDIIKYVFEWDTTRLNMHALPCSSRLGEIVNKHIKSGGSFYCGLGVIEK